MFLLYSGEAFFKKKTIMITISEEYVLQINFSIVWQ